MTRVPASDGLPARRVHPWSDEKLFYVQRYMDIFTTGMKNRWDRLVYADFFSGPGVCIEKKSGIESQGSPLRAVQYQFDRLYLNDSDPEAVDALRARVPSEVAPRVEITELDCNAAVGRCRSFLFPEGMMGRTLGFAFIDPTAFQMSFDSVRRLTIGLQIDIIVTFMTGYVRRFIGAPGFDENSDFHRFMGTGAWRQLVSERRTSGFYRRLLDLYESQLHSIGYRYVDDSVRVLNSQGSHIYHLVFASKHPRGKDFFEKISERQYTGQGRLFRGF